MKALPNLLTRRQYQTAVLLSQGKSIKEIGQETGKSRSSIQYHLFRMRQCFNCSSNFQLGYEIHDYLNQLTAAIQEASKINPNVLNNRWPQKNSAETLHDLNLFAPDEPDEEEPIAANFVGHGWYAEKKEAVR